jgi:branched-chain amino acid transport system permease protein
VVKVLSKIISFKNIINEKLDVAGLSFLSLTGFLILAFAPFYVNDEYTLHLLVVCLMFGTLAMGFDLSAGFISVANWGYAAMMGLGAYTSALLLMKLGISPWIGIFVGAAFAALLGLFIGMLTLKMDGMFAAILAWFVGLVLMGLAASLQWLTRGTLGLNVNLFFDTGWSKPYFYVIFVICVLTYMILRKITNSNLGLAFTALGQDAEAARTCGVNPMKYKVLNFTISCFIAGLCGGFYAHFIGILTPDLLSTKHTVEILVIAYIGGRGSIWGPLLAAFIIYPLFESLNFLVEFKYVIYGVLLILVMIFYPSGVSGFFINVNSFLVEKFKFRKVKRLG